MPRSLLVLLAFCLATNSARTQTCADVRSFDFRDAAIFTGPAGPNEAHALIDGAAPTPDVIALHNGVALVSDDPGAPPSAPPDWRIQLLTNRKLQPDPATWLRVVVLEADHLTGTGAWEFVLALNCDQGHLVRVFQYSAEGVSLKHLDRETLQLYQALWKPEDPHCCPSSHLDLVYAWDPQQHRYRRASAVPGNGFASVPDEKR